MGFFNASSTFNLFHVLALIGGLCLFLFGMNLMGEALERRAGNKLHSILERLTTNKLAGFLTGMGVTAIIQSSSATTVMVVGFVNSGVMTLKQAINVIIGANVGTTITAWVLSLGGISSGNLFVQLLKPASFTPILALLGIIMYMFLKGSKKKDTGLILLGFATLMFGMDAMSAAVAGLRDVPAFQQLFVIFSNPILGVLAGALLTAIIQSSSASVGILQALSSTGQVTFGAAIPIIMGQNIGTCVTALISSVGTTKNAKRTAVVHLSFNIIGTAICLALYMGLQAIFRIDAVQAAFNLEAFLGGPVGHLQIAIVHTCFNLICTLVLLPAAGLLEKLAIKLVPDAKVKEDLTEIDERLLATPAIAIEQCHKVTLKMADEAVVSIYKGLDSLTAYSPELAHEVRDYEDKTDHYEDILGTYLVKLSGHNISDHDSAEAAKLLRLIGDYERISDHAVNIVESAEEIKDKEILLSPAALNELNTMVMAVREIVDLSHRAFMHNDFGAAIKVEPLEQVIDYLKDTLRKNHILRLQAGNCSIEAGFVWSDLLTNMERTADHCSNIAACVIDVAHNNMNLHESLRETRENSPEYNEMFESYMEKYRV